ncbi:hypothetical protein HELRODRAFT_106032 [Helobdella robusta]|uniref:Helicase ATP-binding domain-containing protein n=1 Tax=Helobdella robusta TaxID=6412 RepID=T1EDZ3_HELRO|nr:hypothetical protein HELRODRAFT_106032 [Helobdella robusta]ESO06158.1 hypothetical protein HELRODRAFT_106032 [Helobdella robusta]
MKDDHVLKIYYCSRTHSQLSQFIHEVQNSPYADEIRLTTLGSRSNLCINNVVKRLGSLSLINEKCIDMQKNAKTKSSEPSKKRTRQQNSTCPFYKLDGIAELRDRLLVEVKDIEDLVVTGKQSKSCPYYASRRAVPSARLVVLPYNTLLHKWTRESSGIVLDNNIVIIDEGHNLIDSISQMHSIELSGLQLCSTHSHLMQYLERYKNKLKAKNVLYIDQLIFIINSFIKVFGGFKYCSPNIPKIMTLYDFLFHCRLDNMNLFKIRRYCHKSLIAKKLHGFTQRSLSSLNPREKGATAWALSNFLPEIQQQNALKQKKTIDENYEEFGREGAISPSLNQIVNFLEALTNADKDGRVLITNKGNINQSSIKFLMLNPSIHFKEVVEKARAVIIAGGTMHPISDFKEQLLLSIGVKPNKIVEYTCDHIISRDHLLTITMAHGPSGHHLDFTYNNRGSTDTIKELGRVVYNACYVVPAGVVCFFSSFEYMTQVLDCWRTNGFIEKIEARKMIYKEPKKASEVEKVLEEYSSFINRCQSQPTTARAASFQASNEPMVKDGAIMFCVVGGKMSEGINFSDNMGRCVIMVGLPYPNPNSVELKEKMDYLNSNQNSSKAGKPSGQAYYESICMKAINQSIGRAIRHKNDYACILLLDHRFAAKSVLSKLPAWIQGCVQVHDRFGPALASLKKFFYNKKSEQPDQPHRASIT